MNFSKNDFKSFAEKSPNLTLDDELKSAKYSRQQFFITCAQFSKAIGLALM